MSTWVEEIGLGQYKQGFIGELTQALSNAF
jgi:hypothetical protein